MDEEMMRALEADGEKLRQLTGDDHGPVFLCGECGDAMSDPKSIELGMCGWCRWGDQ
ncbi:MAG: hypothetical protein AAFR84_03045 [Pseudomonadota bacterium]